MAQKMGALGRLPPELRRCILSSMPDLYSLISTVLTCRGFHYVFNSNRDRLIRNVLINCVGSEVLPEATITHRCSPPFPVTPINNDRGMDRLRREENDRLCNYVTEFVCSLERPSLQSTTWTMSEALELETFHVQTVLPLSQRYIKSCVELSPPRVMEISLRSRPVSRLEEERILRTFYRFELFRKIFSRFHGGIAGPGPFTDLFFSKFGHWENAQLGCIHDFLAREVIPAFNDIAENDILWGQIGVCHYATPDNGSIQHILSLGLEKILEIASCDLYTDRERLLKPNETPPRQSFHFLHSALSMTRFIDLSTDHDERLVDATPFYTDGDQGAEQIWCLSSMHTSVHGQGHPRFDLRFDAAEDWPYRRWGYVLWDHERLKALGVLDQPWMPAKQVEYYITSYQLDKMRVSQSTRGILSSMGQRGYWDRSSKFQGFEWIWMNMLYT